MNNPCRVLIVEDDPSTRAFFAQSIRDCNKLHLLADLSSVNEAKTWLSHPSHSGKNGPDVLLTDLGLPDGSGLDVIRHALRHHPKCEAVVISMFGDEDNVLASIEAGAVGYIHKDSAPDNIAQSVLDLKAGASPISPMIARRVLAKYRSVLTAQTLIKDEEMAQSHAKSAQHAPKNVAGLTPQTALSAKEQEVLDLIARGFSYNDIARLNYITVHTVQTHIKNLYAKLAVHSKSEAVYEATRMGLLRP